VLNRDRGILTRRAGENRHLWAREQPTLNNGSPYDDEASAKPDQTGAELVVRGLEAPFGIPGAEIDAVFASLVDPTIKPVAILSNP